MSYVHHTQNYSMICFVGDSPEKCKILSFSDASFAADLQDSKSTSGGFIAIVGPHTFVPITWLCKKQGAISHSSTEAEIIALDALLRMEGIPCLQLWECIVDTLK